jgi:hypothetical protein
MWFESAFVMQFFSTSINFNFSVSELGLFYFKVLAMHIAIMIRKATTSNASKGTFHGKEISSTKILIFHCHLYNTV